MPYIATLTIGSDRLLHRTEVVFPGKEGSASFGASFTRIKRNKRLTAADFRYRLPATARIDPGYSVHLPVIGQQAPEFMLPTLTGERLSLSEIRKGAKGTPINFWYLHCPPCLEELPQYQKISEELSGQGLALITINKGDAAQDIGDYWKKHGYTLPVVLGTEGQSSVFNAYGVEAFPVSILLDATGKVVFRSVGYDEKGLNEALKPLGFDRK